MKRAYYYYIVVALVILGAGYYWYSIGKSGQNETRYVTAAVEKGTLATSITASGNITVDQSATVDPTIDGTVANLSVQVGDSVTEDQLLFTIINEGLDVTVKKSLVSKDQAENTLESAEISEDEAEENYDIAIKKDKKDGASYTTRELEILKDKIDLAEAEVWEAKKNLAAAEASYQNEISNADKRKVTAPINGTVNEINIKNGDDLGKSSTSSTKVTPIIIGDLNTLKAQIQVNEVDIPHVQIGQKVTMAFDAIPNFTATGKVEKVDSLGTITQNVVTYNVTIGFDNLDNRIKPEMSVSASIITNAKQDVITVPNGALKTRGGNNYVEVLKGQTPQPVNVGIGISNNTDTEIVSGLNPGEQVVTQTINANSNANANTNSGSGNRGAGGFGGGGGGIRFLGGGGPRD